METSATKRPKMELELKNEVIIHQVLNYDCIYYILSYLNVRELMVVEEVCVMFKAVAEDIYKTLRVLNFDLLVDQTWHNMRDLRIPHAEVEKIFQRVGPYVETLRLDREFFFTNRKPLKFVWMYCSKLKSVSFIRFTFNSNICTNLSTVFNNVDDVLLVDISAVTDEHLQIMFNLRQIKKLRVALKNVNGDFLTHLQDIQNITLGEYLKLEPSNFVNFTEANTQLTHLDISRTVKINEVCLSGIARNLINLEELCISCDYEGVPQETYLPLMDLPKLKGLVVNKSVAYNNVDIGVLLERLASYDRLESLSIHSCSVPTRTFAQAMESFTKLKKLKFYATRRSIDYLGDLKCDKTLEELYMNTSRLTATGLANIIKKKMR